MARDLENSKPLKDKFFKRDALKSSLFSANNLVLFTLVFGGIGAYILFKSFAATAPANIAYGDLNGDNTVNVSDLSIILTNYATANAIADINSDGTVNIIDLSILLSHYGSNVTSPPTNYNSTILADNPAAFWNMSSSGSSEPDLSGNSHTGTYIGGTHALASMLNGDQAVDFNGSTQYLRVPSSPAFSIPTTRQLTWEGWIRPDVLQFPNQSGDNYVDWMGKCDQYSPTCEWEARMYSTTTPESRCNRLSAYVFNPSAGLGSAADWQPNCNLLQAGQWLYVVAQYQTTSTPSGCNASFPGGIDIWVNGVKWSFASHKPTGCMSQYSVIPQAKSSTLEIGAMAGDTWFKGAVGKVAIYDHLLTQAQINTHYTAMHGAQPSGSCANSCTIPVPTP